MAWLLAVSPVLGIIAMAMSLTHLAPIAVSLLFEDGTSRQFIFSMALNFCAGFLLWLSTRGRDVKGS